MPALEERLLWQPGPRHLASMVERLSAPPCAAHAEALAARGGPGLNRASASFEAMGAQLLAGEAAAI